MRLVLSKKPKGVTIIEGFPGFGLIGTIATEYLLEHLETIKIGRVELDEIPAMVAIHNNEAIEPISLHYCKKYNLVLVHAINIGKNIEWKLSSVILDLAKQLQATEIISLEGVGSPNAESASNVYYYASKNHKGLSRKLEHHASPLMEGIVVGVTGALITRESTVPLLALFAEAKSNLPDSAAAAHVISVLDKYTGLKVDPEPLLDQAKMFESKLKGIASKQVKAEKVLSRKGSGGLSYVG